MSVGFIENWFGKSVLEGLNESDITSFVAKNIEENLHLEYKGKEILKNPDRLRKTIAAFANSDGGLLFVGVSERENGARRLPGEVEWTDNPKQTKEWFQDVTVNQIYPPLMGVRIVAVTNRNGHTMFLVDVPPSDNPPHMTNGRYFFRNNFESLTMEHYQVADAFGKRRRPIIWPILNVSEYNSEEKTLLLEYGISNIGHSLAKWPMVHLVFSFCSVETLSDSKMWEHVRTEKNRNGIEQCKVNYSSPVNVLHAGMQSALSTLKVRLVKSPAVVKILVGAEDATTDTFVYLLGEKWLSSHLGQQDRPSKVTLPVLQGGRQFSFDKFNRWAKEFEEDFEGMDDQERQVNVQCVLESLDCGLPTLLTAIKDIAQEYEEDTDETEA